MSIDIASVINLCIPYSDEYIPPSEIILSQFIDMFQSVLGFDYNIGSGEIVMDTGSGDYIRQQQQLLNLPDFSETRPFRFYVFDRNLSGIISLGSKYCQYIATGLVGDTLVGVQAVEGFSDYNFRANDVIRCIWTARYQKEICDAIDYISSVIGS